MAHITFDHVVQPYVQSSRALFYIRQNVEQTYNWNTSQFVSMKIMHILMMWKLKESWATCNYKKDDLKIGKHYKEILKPRRNGLELTIFHGQLHFEINSSRSVLRV
jgi:hypothetical protein